MIAAGRHNAVSFRGTPQTDAGGTTVQVFFSTAGRIVRRRARGQGADERVRVPSSLPPDHQRAHCGFRNGHACIKRRQLMPPGDNDWLALGQARAFLPYPFRIVVQSFTLSPWTAPIRRNMPASTLPASTVADNTAKNRGRTIMDGLFGHEVGATKRVMRRSFPETSPRLGRGSRYP